MPYNYVKFYVENLDLSIGNAKMSEKLECRTKRGLSDNKIFKKTLSLCHIIEDFGIENSIRKY